MKKMMCIAITVMLFMLIVPLFAMGTQEAVNNESANAIVKQAVKPTKEDEFRVFDKKTGKITKMAASEYVFCVVAAEMPALYNNEALKAQAVASYTYACYKRENSKNGTYDITTDYATDQSFKTKENAKKDWGSKAETYTEKIENAVAETLGQRVLYKGETILAVYHALSSGQTYAANEVWGGDYPYLKSVPSPGDKLAESYKQTFTFNSTELKKSLSSLCREKKGEKLISNIKRSKSGIVESVSVYGQSVLGNEIRSALELPSSNFEWSLKDGKYTFTAYGYGHGVGMSQRGANYMAKQGYNYKQILMHYYTACTVS